MAERAELIRRSGPTKSYGSVSKCDNVEDEDCQRPVKCLCTRRDCILVTVLTVLVAAAITTSLAIGIPAIERKQQQQLERGPPDQAEIPRLVPTSTSKSTSYISTVDTPVSTEAESTAARNNATKASTSAPVAPSNASVDGKPVFIYKRAAVAADDPRCAEVGSSLLKLNGSAVDAAIGTLLCLEAVNPQHSGIGGGFFMVIYSKQENKSYTIDAREVAPANATAEMFAQNESLSATGGLSIAVPGTVQGYWDAHTRFGRLAWKRLFTPTIDLCRNGFLIYSGLAEALFTDQEAIMKHPTLREVFVNNVTGAVYRENDTLHRPGFANTLETLANQGGRYFYEGPIAEKLVGEIQKAGGIISLADLREYTTTVKEALRLPLNDGLHLHTVQPPSSGALLALVLNTLHGMIDAKSPLPNITVIQRLVETLKFAYAFRSQMGDERFVNMSQLIANVTSLALANSIRQRIHDNQTFDPSYYLDAFMSPSEDRGTSHVNVFSADGDVVSVTSTINKRFGSKLRSTSLDVILNDEMDDFAKASSNSDGLYFPANLIVPGKRPLSTMTPSIFTRDVDGSPLLAVGGAGGIAILSSVANVLVRHLLLNQTLKDSISSPRVHHELVPNVLYMEPEFSQPFIEALRFIGHNVSTDYPITHVNAILRISNGSLLAVSDPRMSSGTSGY